MLTVTVEPEALSALFASAIPFATSASSAVAATVAYGLPLSLKSALLVYIVKSLIDLMLLPARIFFATLFETLLLLTTLAVKIFWNATTAALLGAVD